MAIVINQSKSDVVSFTNLTKNNSVMKGKQKQGYGWIYDDTDILYETAQLYYDTFLLPLNFINQIKH